MIDLPILYDIIDAKIYVVSVIGLPVLLDFDQFSWKQSNKSELFACTATNVSIFVTEHTVLHFCDIRAKTITHGY